MSNLQKTAYFKAQNSLHYLLKCILLYDKMQIQLQIYIENLPTMDNANNFEKKIFNFDAQNVYNFYFQSKKQSSLLFSKKLFTLTINSSYKIYTIYTEHLNYIHD